MREDEETKEATYLSMRGDQINLVEENAISKCNLHSNIITSV